MPRLGLIGLSEAEKNLVRSALQLLATRVRTQWELTDHPPCDVLLTATAGVSGGYELQWLSQARAPLFGGSNGLADRATSTDYART